MMNYNMLSTMPPMGHFPPMMGQQMAYIPQRGNNPSMLRPSRYENWSNDYEHLDIINSLFNLKI